MLASPTYAVPAHELSKRQSAAQLPVAHELARRLQCLQVEELADLTCVGNQAHLLASLRCVGPRSGVQREHHRGVLGTLAGQHAENALVIPVVEGLASPCAGLALQPCGALPRSFLERSAQVKGPHRNDVQEPHWRAYPAAVSKQG